MRNSRVGRVRDTKGLSGPKLTNTITSGLLMLQKSKFFALLLSLLCLASGPALAAKVSTLSLGLLPGETASLSVSKIKGTLSASSSDTQVATAVLSGTRVTVTAVGIGSARVNVRDSSGTVSVAVTVKPPMTVTPSTVTLVKDGKTTLAVSDATGSLRVSSSNSKVAKASVKRDAIEVEGKGVGSANLTVRDSKTTRIVSVQVTAKTPGEVIGTTEGRLLASNCFQCHGTNGSGGFEKLLGESEASLYEELMEYRTDPDFASDIMTAHLQGYTEAQIRAIAKYLSNP